eukprot:TRINITY_DN1539_c0_g1_i1.p1 TRINITY_DN1539_c0_g1~~TRINITY_DN1539_c0_g1_i1.p1  ORF type:complete len:997 (-),score=210.12 TRINITY_DN1539_c0_g1_i1:238-3228(-)
MGKEKQAGSANGFSSMDEMPTTVPDLYRPSSNGTDGDDEREEDGNDSAEFKDNDEEAEEEDEEIEPRFKYQRMGGSIPSLLSRASDAPSCIALSERVIALGTTDGTIHILDYQGNQVKEFAVHSAKVNYLCFDSEGEYIGSCSDDGFVVINSLFTDEKEKFEHHWPMKAIALDPDYAKKPSRRFAIGGLAGQLLLSTKGWFGYRDQVLHSGEGPIHAVKWSGSFLAWANDLGVKVYDTANRQRITHIERPHASPCAELLRPHLVWQDGRFLIIGWGTTVRIADIHQNINGGTTAADRKYTSPTGSKQAVIVADFQTDYLISGVAPHGDALFILAYIPDKEDEGKEVGNRVPSWQAGCARRPEVHVVSWKNEDLTADELSIHHYERYNATDYELAHAPLSSTCNGTGGGGWQWNAGEEPLYFIVSPKDVIIAKPRNADDHIAWLVQHNQHDKALAAIESGQARIELLDEVGASYLDHLISTGQYQEAAALCPKLLRGSAAAWERWIFDFARYRQLPALVPYIPTNNPRLRDTAYEVALLALASNSTYHEQLLSIVHSWPSSIYNASTVISAIESQLTMSVVTPALQEALADLYVIDKQYEKAFATYADLKKPGIFEFIEEHDLYDVIQDKVLALVTLDAKRAVTLLVQHRDMIRPSEVVTQIQKGGRNDTLRYALHTYLHELFEADPHAGRDFHGLQVELYAHYEPRLLLPFLRSSQHYSLDKAYEICTRKGLVKEQVYILGRMGNSKEALALIINKLEDMEQAIEFVTMQHDDDLWEELIKQSLNNPEMVGMLLEHTVGNLDPLHIVNMIPNGLQIPRLRDRLVKIITDYRTETSLRHGCNDILKADVVNLLVRYYSEARHGIYIGIREDDSNVKQSDTSSLAIPRNEKELAGKSQKRPSNSRASGRCCICLDPLAIQNVSVVAFFCAHTFHITCLSDTTTSLKKDSDKENRSIGKDYTSAGMYEDESDDESNTGTNEPSMRCILCTTAAVSSKRI